jgi:transcriptional regulator with PAS, ATPase and Fis domain
MPECFLFDHFFQIAMCGANNSDVAFFYCSVSDTSEFTIVEHSEQFVLEKMVEEKTFRHDLYYRLKTITIELPPLRKRKEDIPHLVNKFVQQFAIEERCPPKLFDERAIDALFDYDYPGNVRELKHLVEALLSLTDSDIIMADDVYEYLKSDSDKDQGEKSFNQRVDDFKADLIKKELIKTDGNRSKAAAALGMDRANLHKLIKRLGLDHL